MAPLFFALIFGIATCGSLRGQEDCSPEVQEKRFLSEFTVSLAEKVLEHPFMLAAALWLACYKGTRTLEFLRDVSSNWFIAIPIGGFLLHKGARMVLERIGEKDHDPLCEVTITMQQS